MIRGIMTNCREAVVSIRLRGNQGYELDVDAIVDTGFTASLTLPLSIVTALDLVRNGGGNAILADGSNSGFDIYPVEIDWDGASKEINCYAVGDDALIGMRLLRGYELRVEVETGGLVEIKKMP